MPGIGLALCYASAMSMILAVEGPLWPLSGTQHSLSSPSPRGAVSVVSVRATKPEPTTDRRRSRDPSAASADTSNEPVYLMISSNSTSKVSAAPGGILPLR